MDKEDKIAIGILTVFAVIALAFLIYQPYAEMRAFNKFSNTNATYFDAMFSSLRILPN